MNNKAKHNKTVCIFFGIYCSSIKLHGRDWHKLSMIGTDIVYAQMWLLAIRYKVRVME